jgi:hypothetical protein
VTAGPGRDPGGAPRADRAPPRARRRHHRQGHRARDGVNEGPSGSGVQVAGGCGTRDIPGKGRRAAACCNSPHGARPRSVVPHTGPATDAALTTDLAAVIALQGLPFGKIVSTSERARDDDVVTGKDDDRYRVPINANGRLVVAGQP